MNKPTHTYNIGDEVFWVDSDDGLSSGIYKIVEQKTDDDEYSIYLISNGTSEAEVYKYELS